MPLAPLHGPPFSRIPSQRSHALKPIVTLTLNPSIDGSAQTEVVRPIRKVRTTGERYDPGGGGINVARVVQELRGAAQAVYLAGGATGGVLDDLLDSAGIPRRRISIQDHTRISHAIYERSSGLEFRFVPEGPLIQETEWREFLGGRRGSRLRLSRRERQPAPRRSGRPLR